ncbi:MAG: PLDc N-terminal domain-containing protein [Pyrinomonadaceae bacterium]
MLLFQESGFFLIIYLGLIAVWIGSIVVWIKAIIEIAKSDFKGENDKLVWILIVVLTGIIGAIIYYAVGRNQRI